MLEGDLHPPDAAPPEALGTTWPPPRLEWTAQDSAFIEDIREHPDDDTPRLIYADWLLEQGDPRGLFIHFDIACLTEDDPLRMWTLLRDRRRLLQRYEPFWSPTDKVTAIGGFTRGFLDAVTMTPEEVIAHGAEVFAREPIRELRLDGTASAPTPAIVECAAFRCIARLRVDVADEHVWLGALLDSRHWTALHALTVTCWCGPVQAHHTLAVTQNHSFPRLDTLRLEGMNGTDLARLLDAPGFGLGRLEVPGSIETLPGAYQGDDPVSLLHESIGRDGLELLVRHPAARSLRYLDASYNPVEAVLPAILASPCLANLRTIRVSEREEIDLSVLRAARHSS